MDTIVPSSRLSKTYRLATYILVQLHSLSVIGMRLHHELAPFPAFRNVLVQLHRRRARPEIGSVFEWLHSVGSQNKENNLKDILPTLATLYTT